MRRARTVYELRLHGRDVYWVYVVLVENVFAFDWSFRHGNMGIWDTRNIGWADICLLATAT